MFFHFLDDGEVLFNALSVLPEGGDAVADLVDDVGEQHYS